jgi:hypothetical protein
MPQDPDSLPDALEWWGHTWTKRGEVREGPPVTAPICPWRMGSGVSSSRANGGNRYDPRWRAPYESALG